MLYYAIAGAQPQRGPASRAPHESEDLFWRNNHLRKKMLTVLLRNF